MNKRRHSSHQPTLIWDPFASALYWPMVRIPLSISILSIRCSMVALTLSNSLIVLYCGRKYNLSLLSRLFLWCLAGGSGLVVLISTWPWNSGQPWSPLAAVVYSSLHRSVWSAAIAWVIFTCALGQGGPVNTFLSWKGFLPLSKLSFSMYLVHYLVIWFRCAYAIDTYPFTHYSMASIPLYISIFSIRCSMINLLLSNSLIVLWIHPQHRAHHFRGRSVVPVHRSSSSGNRKATPQQRVFLGLCASKEKFIL